MITYSTNIEDFALEKPLEISIGQRITSLKVECDFEVNSDLEVSNLRRIYLEIVENCESWFLTEDDFIYAIIKESVEENLKLDRNFKKICLEKLSESREE